ncbi:MAG TPA: DUF6069 family protein [Streptosporangiaceae bacterium]|nr:DUF6069 family protein [Streptosporangiaceae bacterium]
MTYQPESRDQDPGHPRARDTRPRVDVGQLCAGGVATAIIAALIALVGILICRWLFNIPILAPRRDGAWGDASTGAYVAVSAAIAVVATAVLFLLVESAPRPTAFFGWIIGLLTAAAAAFPFSTTASLAEKVATAVLNLVLGIAIGSLLSGTARWAVRPPADAYERSAPVRVPGDRDTWS